MQGFICSERRVRLSTVKKWLGVVAPGTTGRAHVEAIYEASTPAQAAAYCKDPAKRHPDYNGFLFEKGCLPLTAGNLPAVLAGRSGARSDLFAAKAKLDEGVSPDELARDAQFFGVVAKHHRYFEHYYSSRTEPRRRCPRVLVMWGDSGCGKTIHANLCDPAVTYFVPIGSSGGTWFDGYDPRKHTTVVFNEWHGGRGSLSELLQWCDPTPLYVNTKGGHVQFVPKLVIFTCNKDPQAWYDWTKCAHPMGALIRRITNQWCYVKQVRPEWNLPVEQSNMYSYAECEIGDPNFHPGRKVMTFLRELPNGNKLFGFAEDPEIGDNVEDEDADKFFV